VPGGAQLIWSSAFCEHQAFALGNSVGMQCHIEMTEAMIENWCESGAAEIEESRGSSAAVQTPQEMRKDMAVKLAALHRVADSVYDRWLQGVTTG
jgi:hypothetical protein